jgi:peroxiredoxin
MSLLRQGSDVPPELGSAAVVSRDGQSRELGSFWAEGPCLVLFLRHFGCPTCAAQVAEISPRLAELSRMGLCVVLVGNGSPDQLAAFAERSRVAQRKVELVTDPSLRAYRAAGLVRSRWGTIGPRALAGAARAMIAGYPHAAPLGDALQQGGALLVDRSGKVAFHHRNLNVGDHATANDMVGAALRALIHESDVHC